MTRGRKFLIGGLALTVLAGAGIWSCAASQQIKLDALAVGARQAVLDVDKEYAAALAGKPAYYGYVVHGDFDFQDMRSRIGNISVAVLDMDQVHAVDWRKEQGDPVGWGPQYVYRRNDANQDVCVMSVTLVRCWRYSAKVRIDHDGGGAVYTLRRWPGQPWQITHAEFEQIVY